MKYKSINIDTLEYEIDRGVIIYIPEEDNDLIEKNGGKIYKIDLSKSNSSPSKVQISNINNACSIIDQFKNLDGTGYIITRTAGSDNICDTLDDKTYLININASPTDVPIDLQNVEVSEIISEVRKEPFGNIEGFYVISSSGNILKKCDLNLQNCQTLITANNIIDGLQEKDIKNNNMYLCIDDNIYILDRSNGSLENTGASCKGAIGISNKQDENNVYFVTENDITKEYIVNAFSKNEKTTKAIYKSNNPIYIEGITSNYLILNISGNSLKAINKTSGEEITLKSLSPSSDVSVITYDNKALYTYYIDNKLYACYWIEGNSQETCLDEGSSWGISVSPKGVLDFNSSLGLDIYKVILVQNYRDIYSVDLNDLNKKEFIGSLPTEYFYGGAFQLGNVGLTFGYIFNGSTYNTDIFLLDLNKKTIKQITNTPDKQELPVIF
jgi:hypothetical protein